MTPLIVHDVYVDTKLDAAFGASIDNISSRIVSLSWRNGAVFGANGIDPYGEVSDGTPMTLTVKNDDGAFIPETTGSELLTNGSFATWSGDNPSNWTVTGESGSDPEVSQVASYEAHDGVGTGAANLYSTDTDAISIGQNILTSGNTYHVVLYVTNIANGAIQCYNNTTALYVPMWAAGRYEFFFNATHVNFKIQNYTGYAGCDVTIDNVSVKQTSKYRMVNKGMLVRLRGTYDSDTQQYYIGRILDMQYAVTPNSNPATGRMVTLTVGEPTDDMQRADYQPPLMQAVATGEVLERIFDDAAVRWPYSGSYALLDTNGSSELDSASLYDHDALDADTGQTTHEYIGDFADRGQGVSLYGYTRDVVEAECMGRWFWQGRTGKYTLHDRSYDTLNTTIAQTITSANITESVAPVYSQGRHLSNRVIINYNAREVGAEGSVVWLMAGLPIEIKNGTSKKVTARYRDPDNEVARVGVLDPMTPSAGVDYVCNLAEDGSSTDVSQLLTMSVEWGASSAKIVFDNHSGTHLWLQAAQLRGTPLISTSEQIEAYDGDSIRQYGLKESPLDIRLLSDRDLANDYANFRVSKFKMPMAQFEQISIRAFQNSTTASAAHNLTVGDKITLTDTYTGHDADYVIVGEAHNYTVGNADGQVTTYTLKPATREIFTVLDEAGTNELDIIAKLAF